MLTTYQVVGKPIKKENDTWEILLTDLNSDGAFQVTVIFKALDKNTASGLVTEGPATYLDKVLTVEILAGWATKDRKEVAADVHLADNPIYKDLSELVEGDRLTEIKKRG